jgi:NADPH-dependent 2,4-dienoyl-CoA reductase/sulfur reductase-like enzyme
MEEFELVIVGGGSTAARAVKSYREAGGGGAVALLTAEPVLPYHRPALSKRYLRGEVSAPFAEAEAFYADHDVEVLLETAATALEARSVRGRTPSGRRCGFRRVADRRSMGENTEDPLVA